MHALVEDVEDTGFSLMTPSLESNAAPPSSPTDVSSSPTQRELGLDQQSITKHLVFSITAVDRLFHDMHLLHLQNLLKKICPNPFFKYIYCGAETECVQVGKNMWSFVE